MAGLLGPNLDN
uniref:Uncharacterized protein n=1 Tax=Anguilla anguilla TaxID=7936 RepID=A0A0E9VE06_ANGAN